MYQPSVFVTTNVFVCVCELHNNSIRRRNDETPSALISILFIIYLSPLIERVESILVFIQLLIYLPTLFVCSRVDFVRHVLVVVHLLGLLAPGADLISPPSTTIRVCSV